VIRPPVTIAIEESFNHTAIGLETEHAALNNYYHLFPMAAPLGENRVARINIETALSHAESRNLARKR
jgi:hypothetical protein